MSNRYKVLFVDDEERVLRSLKSLFRRDYKVFTANSGQEALQLLQKEKIDVIVSDQRMPGMLGHELLSQVKQRYPQMMRLLLTGYMDKDAIVETINSGEIFRFINKPWQVDDIKQTIAEAAQLSQIQVNVEQNHQLSTEVDTRKPEAKSTEKSPVSTIRPDAKKNALLLMDPDQAVRNQVRRLSAEEGFRVYGIQGFESALRTLSLRPNIGVAILGMPIESKETIEAINLFKQKRPDLSIIVLTDMTDAQVAVDLINQGQVFRYLEKPLKHNSFGVAVRSAMTRFNLVKDNTQAQMRYRSETITDIESTGLQKLMSLFKLRVA